MRNYDCVCCQYCRKIVRKTKPQLLCAYGRYGKEPEGGYPVAWIKKCEYDKEQKMTNNADTRKTAQMGVSIMENTTRTNNADTKLNEVW